MSFENIVLSHLIHSEDFSRKAVPYLKAEYFHDSAERLVYEAIDGYIFKYNALPSKEAISVELASRTDLDEDTFQRVGEVVDRLAPDPNTQLEWLVEKTEKFCQDKAVFNAVMQSIQILDGKVKDQGPGVIPKLLHDALGVSFDSHIGHDFLADAESRYDFYHHVEDRIPFDLDLMNKITKGGLPRKTLNIILAGTGVGKTLAMCHFAASNLLKGKNVLYITMEMAEERIAERIDANLLDVTVDQLATMDKETYIKKIDRLRSKTLGKLVIKEYPTAAAGSANFRHLLNELRLKKNFKPDIIYIDYLNICASSRIKMGSSINSYTYVKVIAEELRGLAVEFNVPIISATQTTRTGYSSSDVDLTDTSESFGLPATADMMFALISTEELQDLGQLMVKQLKNRYSAPEKMRRFVIGIDKDHMRLYDVEQSAQDDIMDDRPVMDKSEFGEQDYERGKKGQKFDMNKFGGFR